MRNERRDMHRHNEGHDDAAYHHETAAYHHRQASHEQALGNHDDARRHHTMADYHGQKAYEHGRRAFDNVDQSASYGRDYESYDGGRFEEGPRDFDRDAAWRRANEGGRASFHGRTSDRYGSPIDRDQEWSGGSRDYEHDRSNRGGYQRDDRAGSEDRRSARATDPSRSSDRNVS